jgi:uncharacterized RDD family membrane protein YckC
MAVELEDRIVIATPEGVELQLVLAGVGSRFIAAAIDLFIQLTLIVAAAVVGLALIGGFAGKALFYIAAFAVYLYDVPFEVLASGRTPGKRLTHLRVVRAGGAPVNVTSSLIRNLVRFIDFLPSAYLVGLFSILLSRHNQRLGDHAAGTLVIRDVVEPTASAGAGAAPAQPVDSSGWDVSAVSSDELAAARRFLQRRATLDPHARRALAYRLEQGLRAKVSGAPRDIDPERFLLALVHAKAQR